MEEQVIYITNKITSF